MLRRSPSAGSSRPTTSSPPSSASASITLRRHDMTDFWFRTLAMVLTISSRKGGCGKTVIATILAATLSDEGMDVALLDTDPNRAAYRWATENRSPAITTYAE